MSPRQYKITAFSIERPYWHLPDSPFEIRVTIAEDEMGGRSRNHIFCENTLPATTYAEWENWIEKQLSQISLKKTLISFTEYERPSVQ